jgi:hypothetical protein
MLKHEPLQKETIANQNRRKGYSILGSVDRNAKGDRIIDTVFKEFKFTVC